MNVLPSILNNILLGNQMREKNFQEQNNVSVQDIAAKYPAFVGTAQKPGPTLEASCLGLYPGATFEHNTQDQLNYIDFVNKKSDQNGKINKSEQIKKLNSMKSASGNYRYETYKNVGPASNSTNNNNNNASNNPMSYGNTLSQQNGRDFISDPNIVATNPDLDRNYGITNTFDTGYIDPSNRHNLFANNMPGSLYNVSNQEQQPLQRPIGGIYGGPAAGEYNQAGPQYPPNTVIDLDQFINTNNDTTSSYLMNVGERPIVDFTSNNMVPYATKFTQNMAGTGVRSAYDMDGSTFDSGADNSTPYQTKLASFTGMDDTYMHKRETGPIYSPAEQQVGYVYGAPLIRPDLDEYTQSMRTKRELAPIQSVQVGPGIDLDPTVPANGGFHDYTRVLPNNVSDYKSNQLEGRINAGKYVTGAELPTSYPGIGGSLNSGGMGVEKHRPTSYWTQARRPTMSDKVSNPINATALRPEYAVDFRPKNPLRNATNYGFGSVNPGKSTQNSAPVPRSYGQMQ